MDHSDKKWFKLAIIALLFNIILFPFVKYANNNGVSSTISLVLYFTFASIGMLVYHLHKKTNLKVDKKTFYIIIITTIFMLITNLSLWQSVVIAPNLGYPILIVQGSTVLATLYAGIIEKEDFNLKRIFGVLLIFIGIVLVII